MNGRILRCSNSPVLIGTCFRTNQVFAISIDYDLSTLQLANFNFHAAQVTMANHQPCFKSEIGS